MSPERVDNCVESILSENPDYSEEKAWRICKAMDERGELDADDPASALGDGTCPEGMVDINGACVDVESVDAPASILSAPRLLCARELAGPIERVEQSDGSVRYSDILVLSEGVWTDQSSKQPTHYDPRNLTVSSDNSVNIMHDDDNEVSEVGHLDADSAYVEDGDLYADIVFHMENAASEYADENMQKTLETGGKKGFGGPSVEIPPEGLEIEERGELGYPKTEAGVINGLGLVKNPASRPTAFDTQTANRAVALSGGQTDKALLLQRSDMSEDNTDAIRKEILGRELQMGDVQDDAENIAEELDVPVADVMEVLDPLLDDEDGEGDGDDEPPEMEEGEPEEEEDPEEEDTEMDDGAVAAIEEQIDDLWGEIETLKNEMLDGEDMSEELEEAKEELAAADTVSELQEAADELDKRLSSIEDEEKNPRTLGEGGGENVEGFDWSDPNDHSAQYDATTGTTY